MSLRARIRWRLLCWLNPTGAEIGRLYCLRVIEGITADLRAGIVAQQSAAETAERSKLH